MNKVISVSFAQEDMPALFQSALASLFIALCAQIQISLPFTPVPITFQTLAVMFVGATLGSRKGLLAIVFYLVQGCMGAPVWAGGGSGFLRLLSPTGGYLMAYLLQVFLIGRFLGKQDKKNISVFFVLLFSVCIQMTIGSLWLSQFVGLDRCLAMGFYPFIAGEALKAFFVTCYFRFQKTRFNSMGVL